MASPNMNMRDPTLYRIRRQTHYRAGDAWCIYPMYDFTHCLSDAIEGITHSLCSLEFEDHRPLYDWVLDELGTECHPQQIEFARLNITHTVTRKRRLRLLVEGGHVNGWDDPRMPTLAAVRRRGFPPAAIRRFCETAGVAKREKLVDMALLDHHVREELNETSARVMGVLRPLRVVIDNYPENAPPDELEAVNNPQDESMGTRLVPFSRVIYIERDDFAEVPPPKFRRLTPGREVRLRYAYFVTCTDVVKDESGEVVEVHCTYDPASRGGSSPDGRKVKGTLHWVSAEHAVEAEIRLYDRLFAREKPDDAKDDAEFVSILNDDSLEVLKGCRLEPSLAGAEPGAQYQFERLGYFCVDTVDSAPGALVFNRTLSLRDSWAKAEQKSQKTQKTQNTQPSQKAK